VFPHTLQKELDMAPKKKPTGVIFRRYRTLPNGKVLDAHDYGIKAWPIRVGSDQPRKT
jgi:hypothetical protein